MAVIVVGVWEDADLDRGNGRTEKNGSLRGILEVRLTGLGGHLEVRVRSKGQENWETELKLHSMACVPVLTV